MIASARRQSQYDARLERLQEMERDRERRHAERLRDVEAAQFEARQKLLRDMDHLRAREQVEWGDRGSERRGRFDGSGRYECRSASDRVLGLVGRGGIGGGETGGSMRF